MLLLVAEGNLQDVSLHEDLPRLDVNLAEHIEDSLMHLRNILHDQQLARTKLVLRRCTGYEDATPIR